MSQAEKHSREDWSLPSYTCRLHCVRSHTHFPTPISSCRNPAAFLVLHPISLCKKVIQTNTMVHQVWTLATMSDSRSLASRIHVAEGQNQL